MSSTVPATLRRRLLLQWTVGARVRLTILIVVVLLWAAASAVTPLLIGNTLDIVLSTPTRGELIVPLLAIAVAGVFAAALNGVRLALGYRIAETITASARLQVFSTVIARTPLQIERHRQGSLLAALTADITALRSASRDAVPSIVSAIALFGLALTVMFTLSPALTAVVLAGIPVIVLLGRRFRRISRIVYADQRERLSETIGQLAEDVRGASSAVAFGRDADRRRRFADTNDQYLDTEFRGMRARNLFFPMITAVEGTVTICVIAIGGAMTVTGRIDVGIVATFTLALGQIFGPIRKLSDWTDQILSGSAALTRLHTVIAKPAGLHTRSPAIALPARGALTFDDVSFGYGPARQVLHQFSLHVPQGERVALMGATGGGKSTIARLAARWADPDTGTVNFGEVDLRDTDPGDLHRRVLFLPQEGLAIPGTVRQTLTLFAPTATDSDFLEALASVGAHELVDLETEIAELSSGHSQIVMFAGVLLTDPALVILDEAASALDPVTAARIDVAIAEALRDRTVLVIAHRIETASRCDRILTLADGQITEDISPNAASVSERPISPDTNTFDPTTVDPQ